jgi:hypothetical protein
MVPAQSTSPPRVAGRFRAARHALRQWMYGAGLRSSTGLTVPDFLGIGAQKSGTTWLYENLRAHPQAFLPEPKELHYFDQRFGVESFESYCQRFAPGVGKIKGEITPAYGILPRRIIRFIRSTMPALLLVFLMRNPIERAWSHTLMDMIWQKGRRYEEFTEDDFLVHFRSDANVRRGDYETILDHWLAEFPREQLFVGFFEDITQAPTALLADVFRHLGLSADVDWEQFPYRQVVYRSQIDVPIPPRCRQILADLYRPRIERLAKRFGSRVTRWESP